MHAQSQPVALQTARSTDSAQLNPSAKYASALSTVASTGTLLMLDMNAPYTVADCIQFAHAVEPFDIYWLEEPLHWYLQPEDYVQLASATSIPLAHGEREWHRFTIRDFLKSGALTFVQFDSTRHAGFTESLRIAHFAEQQGV